MITANQSIAKFGQPGIMESSYMIIWIVPPEIINSFTHVRFTAKGTIGFPSKIYLNKELLLPLEKSLRLLISNGLSDELKSWDGCYIIRNARGLNSWSLHSWGLAIDINALTNRLGHSPTLSTGFVKCFIDAGFDWGGIWKRPDGMHFQLAFFKSTI